jgi:anti-sigma regulatory factor (Ser/Thr protein kinase)
VSPATAANPAHGIVRLEIPARAEWVAVARLAVAAVASRQRFSVDDIEDIKLAVAESCTNAIQHGTPDGTIKAFKPDGTPLTTELPDLHKGPIEHLNTDAGVDIDQHTNHSNWQGHTANISDIIVYLDTCKREHHQQTQRSHA